MPSFIQKTSLKYYPVNKKMYLYKKKNESQQFINSLGMNFPVQLLSKNKYSKFNNSVKSNNSIKINKNNNKNKNNNSINNINNKSGHLNKNKNNNNYIHSNFNINNSNILNNSKISNSKKNNTNISNSSNITFVNNSASHNYNHKTNKNKSSNPVNTYIINTLNVSEKDFLRSGITSAKPLKLNQKNNKDYEAEINKIIKEKEESQNIVKKQGKLIEKLIEDNQKLENKIKEIIYENQKISRKIEVHQDNQEQLIMLVKIVQKSGVDVEELIDKWNNDVENENENNNITNDSNNFNNNESYTDSTNELNSKIDPSSFIPINIEEPHINKKVFKGIPKLNFDTINNRDSNKKKFRNNSK